MMLHHFFRAAVSVILLTFLSSTRTIVAYSVSSKKAMANNEYANSGKLSGDIYTGSWSPPFVVHSSNGQWWRHCWKVHVSLYIKPY